MKKIGLILDKGLDALVSTGSIDTNLHILQTPGEDGKKSIINSAVGGVLLI